MEKYLVRQKGFTVEYNMQEKKENLGHIKEMLAEFEERMNAEVRRQEKLDMVEERDFRRGELPGKFTTKMLYEQNNRKFKKEYLRKLERNWQKWKSVSLEEKS